MDRKKGIIAIVLFVFLGLMVFSFANPAGDEATTKLDSTNSENIKEEEKDNKEEVEETETTTTAPSNNQNTITNNSSNTSNQNNETTTEEESTETNTPSDEETDLEEDKKEDEEDKKEEEKDYSKVIALVENLEKKINNAITSTKITDMDEARDYNINEKIEDLVSKIEDEEIKKELTEKLEELYKVLNDEVKPKPYSLAIFNYTHATEGGDVKVANTGDKIRVIAYFNEKLNVEPKITIDGIDNEIELNYSENMSTSTRYVYVRNIKLTTTNKIKDGDILVKIVSCKDMANNSCELVDSTMTEIQNETYPYVNFDKTSPKFNIGNGASFESNTIEVIDENFDYMIMQDMTTGKKTRIEDSKYELTAEENTENRRIDFIAYDKAGNVSKRTNYYLDNVKPYITGTGIYGDTEVEFVNEGSYKSVKLNIIDKNLNKVVIYKDDVEIDTKTYAWNADKTTVLEYTEDGSYRIVLSDRANHVVEYTFTIDNVSALVGASNILVNGDVNEQSIFYATNKDQILAYVRFNEKLGVIPTFTFHNNGKDYIVDTNKVTVKSNDKGEYTYSVLFDIKPELDMTDGEITFTLSNIKDEAGNDTKAVLKPTNGHKVYLDRTPSSIEWNGTIYESNYTKTIVTNEQFIANVIETGSGVDVIYQNGVDRTYNGKVLNVSGHSSYKFEIIDKAGNKSTYNVIIDKKVETKSSSIISETIDKNNSLYNAEYCGGNEFVCDAFNHLNGYTFTFEEPVKLVKINGLNVSAGNNYKESFNANSNAIYGLSTTDYSKTISIKFNEIILLDYNNNIKSHNTILTFEDKNGNKITIDKVNGNNIVLALKRSLLSF